MDRGVAFRNMHSCIQNQGSGVSANALHLRPSFSHSALRSHGLQAQDPITADALAQRAALNRTKRVPRLLKSQIILNGAHAAKAINAAATKPKTPKGPAFRKLKAPVDGTKHVRQVANATQSTNLLDLWGAEIAPPHAISTEGVLLARCYAHTSTDLSDADRVACHMIVLPAVNLSPTGTSIWSQVNVLLGNASSCRPGL